MNWLLEKGVSNWLTVIPIDEMGFTLNKGSFGMGVECKRYHSRLAELVAAKKGESYATTMSWIRARVSFALLKYYA